MLKITPIIFFVLAFFQVQASQDIILNARAATALNTVTLYSDSSFFIHSNTYFNAGALFEVLEESVWEHEDDSQHQKFKWYKVKSTTGKIGWIFGDGLAVVIPKNNLPAPLKNHHQQKINLDSGFENALMWVAAIEGRDNLYAQDFRNPIYNEYYLVITNPMGRSVHINISNENARGRKVLQSLDIEDVTGDQIPELILHSNSYPVHSQMASENVAIYSAQAGTLSKVFEERLSLAYTSTTKSPALNKHIEIRENIIRVEYVDYVNCKASVASKTNSTSKIKCLEYVTYTYIWHPRKKMYEVLYEESRSPIQGTSKYGIYLKDNPSYSANTIKKLERSEPLTIIKHFEKAVISNGDPQTELFFIVETQDGTVGYLPARDVSFRKIFHAAILNNYYLNSRRDKNEWSYPATFIHLGEREKGKSAYRG